MDTQKFDRRYNMDSEVRDFSRDSYQRYVRRKQEFRRQKATPLRERRAQPRPRHRPTERIKPSNTRLRALIQTGKSHYDDYDFFEAIAQWEKALELSPGHVAVHYNLACAYSLTEQADKSFFHLDQAVRSGFKDFAKLKDQDALAFLRIQDDFDAFQANGFRLADNETPPPKPVEKPKEEAPRSLLQNPNLLEQLKELGELRDRGLLTQEEFLAEKKKLL
ncbi:MAG: hypothetical protein HKN16_06520 [Saprospiraceae bacterium]|nr:hypothetical protein [Saprospiraceae bacterium]